MRFLTDLNRAALVTQAGEVTYARLLALADRYRRLLGGYPGGKTVIFAENRAEWIYAFYGSWQSGAVNIPLDFMSTPDDIRFVLGDCRPDTVFYSRQTGAVLREALKDPPPGMRLLNFDELELPPAGGEVAPFPEADPDGTALILYTSGTTGGAKGVKLSYDNLGVNIESVSTHVPIFTPGQRVMALLPLHHILPLMGTVIAPLATGGTVVFCPSLSPPDILATLRSGRITILVGVPRLYHLFQRGIMEKIRASAAGRLVFFLAGLIGSPALSRKLFRKVHEKFGGQLRFLVSGGAAIDPVVHRDFLTLGFDLLNGFGMTETAPMITFTRPGKAKVGSAGQLLPGCEIRFEDGEILVRGRNVMQGYHGKEDETEAVMGGGWLHTGDLGRLDGDGHLFITGRKKEIIVLSNGKKINPEEIEKKILAMTGDIVEIGVYAAGDALKAVILPDFATLSQRGILNLEEAFRWELLDAYNKTVPSYRRITDFTLVRRELPKTRLGKLKRFQLQALAAGGRDRNASLAEPEPDLPEYRALKEFLEKQTGNPVRPEDHIEIDLALDSLDKVTLLVFMDTAFGLPMTEQALMLNPTVMGLAGYAAQHKTRFESKETDWGSIFNQETEIALPRSSFLHLALKHLAGAALRAYFRIQVRGLEHLPRPPFIIAPNHQSAADGLLACVFLSDRLLKKTFFFAKDKYFRRRWLRGLAARSNIIVMNIDFDLRGALAKMAAVLKKGNSIIVFPEGTRTRDGSVGGFKKTFAILSREIGVPIVPLAIQGAFKAFPRGSRLPRSFARIRVTFLPQVQPDGLSYEQLSDLVHGRITEQLARGAPG